MTPQQILAGWLAGKLLRLTYGVTFTDMSPFRAMRVERLRALGMQEQTYGWNLEMQMRVAAKHLAHSGSAGRSSLPAGRGVESFRQSGRRGKSGLEDRHDLSAAGAVVAP